MLIKIHITGISQLIDPHISVDGLLMLNRNPTKKAGAGARLSS